MANELERGMLLDENPLVDISSIRDNNLKELMIKVRDIISKTRIVLNKKTTGQYLLYEFLTGETFFQNPNLNSTTPKTASVRPVHGITVNFGQLPNTATKAVAHNISVPTTLSKFTGVQIIGEATDTSTGTIIPIPYSSPVLADNIACYFDTTNVYVITGNNRTNFNECKITLKYLKD